ncbi:MAG: exodeoxyribonuclease V subunit gamma, partial [Desulfamplus sp.]|nr:exodeoxyribonuclease V subunit gamma [Desulfamplus sp.]
MPSLRSNSEPPVNYNLQPANSGLSPINPGFSVIHSNHLEDLRDIAVEWIASHPLKPLENEHFLVQSRGMGQWLKMALASDNGCGISAALTVQLPGHFMWHAYRAVLGDEGIPVNSPYDQDRLVWRLLRLLPRILEEPDNSFSPLKRFLAEDDPRKLYQLACQIASLFDQYQVYRADWLKYWGSGKDLLINSTGESISLLYDQIWQSELWRKIRCDIPIEQKNMSRADLHERFLKATADLSYRPSNLPRRVMVFGISSMPATVIEALHALSCQCQVLLFVQNPCRHYWADIIEERNEQVRYDYESSDREMLSSGYEMLSSDSEMLFSENQNQGTNHNQNPAFADDRFKDQASENRLSEHISENRFKEHTSFFSNKVNPLLAAWGKQGKDYIGMLEKFEHTLHDFQQTRLFRDVVAQVEVQNENENGNLFKQNENSFKKNGSSLQNGSYLQNGNSFQNGSCLQNSSSHQNGSLLEQIQQAILDLEHLPDMALISADDQSITFQLCHSPQREMEVLHDQLLSFFDTLPGLTPRDIIVMTPDINAYAPHIDAVFGNFSTRDPRYIPFTIADKPEQESISMLLGLEKLLCMPDSRMNTADVMELLQIPAFRQKFELEESDIPKLNQWIQGSGIRWGLTPEHRSALVCEKSASEKNENLFEQNQNAFEKNQNVSEQNQNVFEQNQNVSEKNAFEQNDSVWEQNTWQFGLRRMMLGYATGSADQWQNIEPYDEVGGLESALAGTLFSISERLENHWKALTSKAEPEVWCYRIRQLLKDFFLPKESKDLLWMNQMEELLEKWLQSCSDASCKDELELVVVRDYILKAMTESSISHRFLAGMVNFCTMMPMRAIPFRIVCLLGMNDGA